MVEFALGVRKSLERKMYFVDENPEVPVWWIMITIVVLFVISIFGMYGFEGAQGTS